MQAENHDPNMKCNELHPPPPWRAWSFLPLLAKWHFLGVQAQCIKSLTNPAWLDLECPGVPLHSDDSWCTWLEYQDFAIYSLDPASKQSAAKTPPSSHQKVWLEIGNIEICHNPSFESAKSYALSIMQKCSPTAHHKNAPNRISALKSVLLPVCLDSLSPSC